MKPVIGDRSLFPDLQARAYLAHAAISPVSAPVREAVSSVLDSYARHGVGAFPRWMEQRTQLKATLAGLMGARPEDLGLVANTTTGVLDIAQCLPFAPGDRVLSFRGEFPTNITPWQTATGRVGGRVDLLSLDGFGDRSGDGLARVEAELQKGGVKLVAVSAVQFQNGLTMPLAALSELAHAHGAELFVDAIQAVGVVPIDVVEMGVDYLAAGSHKWLMGTEGCGVLYVSPERIAALEPVVAGWMSHEDGFGFLFEPGQLRYDRPIRKEASFVEAGAFNTAGFAALGVSGGMLAELGIEAIFAHVQAWHDRAEAGLEALGFTSLRASDPAARSGTLSLRPPTGTTAAQWAQALAQQAMVVTQPDGCVRLAPHWPNALEEADLLLEVCERLLASGLS